MPRKIWRNWITHIAGRYVKWYRPSGEHFGSFFYNHLSYFPLIAFFARIFRVLAAVSLGVISVHCFSNCSNYIFFSQHPKSYENGTHRFRLQKQALTEERNKSLVSCPRGRLAGRQSPASATSVTDIQGLVFLQFAFVSL